MYLSRAYMNRLTPGQRLGMNLLGYLSSYANGETDLYVAQDAILSQLTIMQTSITDTHANRLCRYDELFSIEDDGLNIHLDKAKELCQLLRTTGVF